MNIVDIAFIILELAIVAILAIMLKWERDDRSELDIKTIRILKKAVKKLSKKDLRKVLAIYLMEEYPEEVAKMIKRRSKG